MLRHTTSILSTTQSNLHCVSPAGVSSSLRSIITVVDARARSRIIKAGEGRYSAKRLGKVTAKGHKSTNDRYKRSGRLSVPGAVALEDGLGSPSGPRSSRPGSVIQTGKKTRIREIKDKDPDAPRLKPARLAQRLQGLCARDKIDEAISVLQNSPLDAQNTPVWNTMIWECMKTKLYRVSYKLYIDMKRRGFKPSTRTYRTMLGGLSRIDDWRIHPVQLRNAHALYEYLQDHYNDIKAEDPTSLELDLSPLAFYITILGDAEEHNKLFSVFYSSDESGPLAPDVLIYTSMFNALSKRRKAPGCDSLTDVYYRNASDARVLWKRMLKSSETSTPIVPDSHCVAAAIQAMARGGRSDQSFALEIVYQYLGITRPEAKVPHAPKVQQSPQALDAALLLCNEMGQYELCIRFARQFMDKAPKRDEESILDRHHIERVLTAHTSLAATYKHHAQEAVEVIRWMLRQEALGKNGPKIRPAASTFNQALLACWRGADWTNATRSFELMTGYRAADFLKTNRATPPRPEKRSKGRNLIPSAETMSAMVRAALAFRRKEGLQQCLRMIDHLGLNYLLYGDDVAHGEELPSKQIKKNRVFWGSKLAAAVVEAVESIGRLGKGPARLERERKQWDDLKRDAKNFLKANGAENDRSSTPELVDNNVRLTEETVFA